MQEDGWALTCRLPEEAVEGTARIRSQRSVVKVPSRTLRSDRTQCGSKKPINGVYKSSEYRKPSKGFDLPKVGSAVLDLGAHVGWFTLWCLDNGADIEKPKDNGARPLYVAAANGHIEVCK